MHLAEKSRRRTVVPCFRGMYYAKVFRFLYDRVCLRVLRIRFALLVSRTERPPDGYVRFKARIFSLRSAV